MSKTRLIKSTFKTRDKIIWLTSDVNEKMKAIKKKYNLASMEDTIVFLLNEYEEISKTKSA